MTAHCANCGTADPGKNGWCKGRCWACYLYRWRTGRERGAVRCYGGVPVSPTCVNCGRPHRGGTFRLGRECSRCHQWRWRKGVPWPEGAIYRVAS